jgi:chorismate mutase
MYSTVHQRNVGPLSLSHVCLQQARLLKPDLYLVRSRLKTVAQTNWKKNV